MNMTGVCTLFSLDTMPIDSDNLKNGFALLRVLAKTLNSREYKQLIAILSPRSLRLIQLIAFNLCTKESERLSADLKKDLRVHRLKIHKLCDKTASVSQTRKLIANSRPLLLQLNKAIEWLQV